MEVLPICFMLLPFTLFAGQAAQAIGVYLFGIIIPILYHRKNISIDPKGTFYLGLMLLGCYLIFPIINYMQLLADQNLALGHSLLSVKILSSRFSTGLIVTAIALIFLGAYAKRSHITPSPLGSTKMLRYFLLGSTIAALLLASFVTIQLTTGYHFSDLAAYRPDRMLSNSFYRVTGILVHPIPFAGFSLTFFSFFWSFFWQNHRKRVDRDSNCSNKALSTSTESNKSPSPLSRDFWHLPAILDNGKLALFNSVLFFYFVIASGSRMASLIAVIIGLGVLWFSKALSLKSKIYLSTFGIILFALIAVTTGLIYRIHEVFANSTIGGLGERKYFWQTYWQMIQDKPLIGYGHYWISSGVRELYYNKMAFAALDKTYNAHNLYLEILASIGIIGSIVLTLLSGGFFFLVGKLINNPNTTKVKTAFYIAIIAQLLFGMTQNTLFDTPVLLPLLGIGWLIFWMEATS